MEFSEHTLKRRIGALLPARSVNRRDRHQNGVGQADAARSETVDVGGLSAISDDEGFLREAYRLILGREVDVSGFVGSLELLRRHVPRRVILLQLINSDEGRDRRIRFTGVEKVDPSPRGRTRFLSPRDFAGRMSAAIRDRIRSVLFARFDSLDHKLNFLLRDVARLGEATAAVRASAAETAQAMASFGEMRGRIQPPVISAGDVLATEVEGLIVGVPGDEWRAAAYHAFRGAMEPGLTKYFRTLIKPGNVVVDVGANVGFYTLLAAQLLQGKGRIYSFEPAPRTYKLLKDNVQVNGFLEPGMICLHQLAVTDRSGRSRLSVFDGDCAHNTLFSDGLADREIEVSTTPLDEIPGAQERVDLVKIDAQGAEPLVVRGMWRLVERNPGIRIVLEFAPALLRRAGFAPGDFLEDLASFGFTVRRIHEETGDLLEVTREALTEVFSAHLQLERRSRAGASL